MREDPAAEPSQDPAEDQADPPGPHDADGLSVEVEPEQPLEREVALTNARVRAVELPVEGQNERERVLSDGVR